VVANRGGALLALVGMVWIAQGVDVLGESGMSGHAIWAVIGAVLVVVGFAMVVGGYPEPRAIDPRRRVTL